MEGSDDIFVHKFSISMGGKTLFKDAKLSLAHGRRYGLIGAPPAVARPQQLARTDAWLVWQVRTAAARAR